MFENSIMLRREALPRVELDALLARYREAADRHGPSSRRAISIRNELIETNMRLATTIAKHYRARSRAAGWETDDVLAICVPGLITAIERFELARGLAFSTYASWWIRHAISRALADTGSTIRVPVHAQAHHSDEQPTKCTDAARAARRVSSLDAPVSEAGDSHTTHVDLLADHEAVSIDVAIVAEEDAGRVHDALEALPEKYRTVVGERTLSEIGMSMGRSRERVRQLQNEAFQVMRAHLGEA